MNHVKHTPGPWLSGESHEHPNKILICDLSWLNRHIAYMPIDAMPEGEQEANASLITAAPAMELALQLLSLGLARITIHGNLTEFCFDGLRYSLNGKWEDLISVIGWEETRAAIAKATGKETQA